MCYDLSLLFFHLRYWVLGIEETWVKCTKWETANHIGPIKVAQHVRPLSIPKMASFPFSGDIVSGTLL